MRDYGGAIRKLRKYYEYTQQQLAEKLNVSNQAVSKWENNTNQIDLDIMREMCEVFGVSIDSFVRIADGVPVSDVLKSATAVKAEAEQPAAVPIAAAAADVSAAPKAKKKVEPMPIAIASALLAVIIAFVIATCVVFIPRTMSANEIYNTVNPSVFFISVNAGTVKKGGSGFFIDDGGTAVTNFHVLSGGTDAEVTLHDGKKYKIDKILGVDASSDIAVFHVDVPKSQKVKIADSDKVKTGDKVYAIGYPEAFVLGTDSSTLTDGTVSKSSYNIDGINYIQTNADFTHGNSGGVLVNDKGQVIGITTGTLDLNGVSYMNFALPINNVNKVKRNYSCSLKEYTAAHHIVTVTLKDGYNVYWKKELPAGERLSEPSTDKQGYEFDGWYTDKNFIHPRSFPEVASEDITLYGKWIPHTYKIKFDPAGGEGDMLAVSVKYGERFRLPDCTFTKANRLFGGWTCGGATFGDGEYISDLTDKDGEELVFTAVWTEPGVTVSFNLGGASGEMKDLRFAKGAKCVLPECSVTYGGYKFVGWKYGNKVYKAGDEITGIAESATITVTAQWEAYSYVIRFVNPYGENTMADMKVNFGKSAKLPKSTYTLYGSPMLYWRRYVRNDFFTVERYDDGDTVKDLSDEDGDIVELTACWDSVTIGVELDPLGGWHASDSKNVSFDSASGLKIDNFGWSKDGCYWDGWEIDGRIYRYGDTFSVKTYRIDTYKAKAVWIPRTYRFTYECEKEDWFDLGCGHSVTDVFVYSDSGYVMRNPFANDHPGYEFIKLNYGHGGNFWQPGDLFDLYGYDTDVSIKVRWRPKKFENVTIEIENDEGMRSYSGVYTWTYGTDILSGIRTLASNGTISKKSGHSISSCEVYVNGTKYNGDLTSIATDVSDEIRVVVLQEMNSYTVEFIPLYSTTERVTLRYDQKYTLPVPSEREGYVFRGWSIGGKLYEAGSVADKMAEYGSVEARGTWKAIEYTLKFDLDGGEGKFDDYKCEYDKLYTLTKNTPNKEGKVFLAWECDGIPYLAGGGIKNLTAVADAELTLRAKWGDKYKGQGNANSPYLVDTYEQLSNLYLFAAVTANASAHYKLTSDIDCGGREIATIGVYDYAFSGVFDGDNHIISDVEFVQSPLETTPHSSTRHIGLFGSLVGTVCRLGIDGYKIEGDVTDRIVGPIASPTTVSYIGGTTKSAVVNHLWARGNITLRSVGGTAYVGGLFGKCDVSFEYCYSQGTINVTVPAGGGRVYIGGLTALTKAGVVIENSYANADITLAAPSDGKTYGTVGGLTAETKEWYDSSSSVRLKAVQVFVAGSYTVTGGVNANAFSPNQYTANDSYIASEYKVSADGEESSVPSIPGLERVAAESLQSADWAAANLLWDISEWNFTQGAFPTLKGFERGGEAQ